MMNIPITVNENNPQLRAFAILAQIAQARSQVYRWLALGFYAPDEQLVYAINSHELVRDIEKSIMWLGQDQLKLQDSLARLRQGKPTSLVELTNEYNRRFGKSAERISMRESTYRWREASTVVESTNDLARALSQQYAQYDVMPAQDQADQLAVELEFLTFMCDREAANWMANASENARQMRRQERTFLDDHLARWFPEFCWRVTNQPQESFYRSLAQLTQAWLKLEYGPGYAVVR